MNFLKLWGVLVVAGGGVLAAGFGLGWLLTSLHPAIAIALIFVLFCAGLAWGLTAEEANR